MNVLAEVLHFSNGSRASTSCDGGKRLSQSLYNQLL